MAGSEAVVVTHIRFPETPREAAEALARAQEFDRRAGLAMCASDEAAYQHNRDQARAAWSRYRALVEKK